MKLFEIQSYQLAESKKWSPAGMLITGEGTFQEVDFYPENRFNTKEEADNFFRNYYIGKGYIEKK